MLVKPTEFTGAAHGQTQPAKPFCRCTVRSETLAGELEPGAGTLTFALVVRPSVGVRGVPGHLSLASRSAGEAKNSPLLEGYE
jgi:hypothetical protein